MIKVATEIHDQVVDLVETQKQVLSDQEIYERRPSDYEIGYYDALCNLLAWIEDDDEKDFLLERSKYFGKKTHSTQCYYCGVEDGKVEAGGIWHCPNPLCIGPGVNWFIRGLKSFRKIDNGYSADGNDLIKSANTYLKDKPELRDKILKLSRGKDDNG